MLVPRQAKEDGSRLKEARHILLIKELWKLSTEHMEFNELLEFISKPSGVLDAVKSGNLPFLELLLKFNPESLMIVDSKKRTLFHTAVLYRQESILIHMIEKGKLKDLVMQAVDDDRNNILHMAAKLLPPERIGSSQPDIQIQRELLWFKVHLFPFYSL